MARVYRATDIGLCRPVVLKVMKLGLDQVERERFLAEARALARLNSPHILEILDFGEQDGTFYFVMPFLRVLCLADLMEFRRREGRHFTSSEAAAIGLQVGRALEEAHAHEFVHRDVKPQNLLITPTAKVYLTDFGIVRDLKSAGVLTQVGTVLGTPRYMAPEQLRGQPVDFSTDLYSLGLILHEMLQGRVPGEVPGDLAATLRYRLEESHGPVQPGSETDSALASVLDGLLLPQAQRLHRSAQLLTQELTALAGGPETLEQLGAEVQALLGSGARSDGPGYQTSPWTLLGIQATGSPATGDEPPPPVPRPAPAEPAPEPPAEPDPRPSLLDEARRQGSPSAARRLDPATRSRHDSQVLGRTGEDVSGTRRLEVPPLARPRQAPAPAAQPSAALVPRSLLVLALAGLGLLLWLLSSGKPSGQLALVDRAQVTVGFHKIHVDWAGDVKELSLVTPRGHEELYDVRDRQEWDSGTLVESGNYSASLVTQSGASAMLPGFEFRPFVPDEVPALLERDFGTLRFRVTVPREVGVEVVVKGSGLSVARTSSTSPAREHLLELKFDPLETASYRLFFRSRLGEEAACGSRALPSLATAFRQAAASTMELHSKAPWRSFYAGLFGRMRGRKLEDSARREIAALGLRKAFEGLTPAIPGFLTCSTVPLEARNQLLEALNRASDPEFFGERYGLPAAAPLLDAVPPEWTCTTTPNLSGTESIELPFDGIMSFKPRYSEKLSSYDLTDEVTRVESKDTEISLDHVDGLRRAELMLETWALTPEQSFLVTVNGRLTLEFRVRGLRYQQALAAKQTVSLYHQVDRSVLVEGKNQFRIAIRCLSSNAAIDSAALNSAVFYLERAPRSSGRPTIPAGGDLDLRSSEEPVQPAAPQGSPAR